MKTSLADTLLLAGEPRHRLDPRAPSGLDARSESSIDTASSFRELFSGISSQEANAAPAPVQPQTPVREPSKCQDPVGTAEILAPAPATEAASSPGTESSSPDPAPVVYGYVGDYPIVMTIPGSDYILVDVGGTTIGGGRITVESYILGSPIYNPDGWSSHLNAG